MNDRARSGNGRGWRSHAEEEREVLSLAKATGAGAGARTFTCLVADSSHAARSSSEDAATTIPIFVPRTLIGYPAACPTTYRTDIPASSMPSKGQSEAFHPKGVLL